MTNKNNWSTAGATIETVGGTQFDFLNPKVEDIDIKDIAFSLANQCRFNGHVPFLSVAEHSVSVAARLPPSLQLAGLLHDAAEAYLSDIPSPIKKFLPDYCAMEDKIQAVIYEKFGVVLSAEEVKEVKEADKDATSTEAFNLLKSKGKEWSSVFFYPQEIYAPALLPPQQAFKVFMMFFSELMATGESKLVLA